MCSLTFWLLVFRLGFFRNSLDEKLDCGNLSALCDIWSLAMIIQLIFLKFYSFKKFLLGLFLLEKSVPELRE